MTTPSLPNGFVPAIAPGYSYGEPGGVVRTDVSGGAPRYALDFDRGAQQFKVSLVLADETQIAVWTAFYHHVIKKGSISFTMPLDSGFGTQTHTVNIVPGSYGVTRTDGIVRVVTFTVEGESTVYDMSDADAQGLVDLWNQEGDNSPALLAALAQFALTDTLVLT